MKQRWIFQSQISKTPHQRPAHHSGMPTLCSPWLIPSQMTMDGSRCSLRGDMLAIAEAVAKPRISMS